MFRARTVALLALCAQPLFGGVVLDGSFGTHGALPGPNFMITPPMGREVNTNLFQSFSQFNLNSSQSATFTGPANVQNILARVTSGGPSSIDGTIRSDIHGANLFFMNPAGVMFGKDAKLDVSGSFAVTTASYLNLVGGGRFNANLGGQDTLTSAPVSAFGFLDQTPAAVSITGSNRTRDSSGNIVPGLGLDIAPHKSFSVVAGDIAMNAGTITGPESRVNLVSVKSRGEVQLDATNINSPLDVSQFTAFGTISLSNLALIGEVQLENATLSASAVVVRGGQLTMDNSQIAVAALNPGDGADIKMEASIKLANLSSIEVTAFSDFANVTVASISAPTISIAGSMEGGSSISSLGSGAMSAGNIDITAQHLELTDGGLIQSSTSGSGAGGSVRVDAATVSITSDLGQSQISADTSGHGAAGNVQLNVTGQLTIAGAAQVSSDTFGAGAGGNIIIAAQSAVVDGRALGGFTAISTESQAPTFGGPAGNIVLNIRDTLQLLAGGEVGAFTIGKGAGGRIDVNAARVFISGEGAALTGITASTENEIVGGPGGDIQLNLTGSLEIVAGGEISVRTSGPGAGGNVNITAPLVSISGVSTFGIPSSISAAANGGVNGGRGGNIVITADSLEGSDGGEISASTAGSGVGGSIDITARRLVLNNFTISADTTSPDMIALPVTVSQLNVSFDMDATTDRNIDLALISPNFTMVDLFHGVGGTGHNFRNTILADEAPISIADGQAPFRGRFHPLNALAAFDTQPFNGTWILFFSNTTLADHVTLNSWSLTVGSNTFGSNVAVGLPGPGGSANNFSTIDVNLPPAAIVPIKPGNGGDVQIHAGTLNMSAGASIAASSTGNGNAGSVLVNANGEITLRGGSSITTSSVGADAGVIDIASGAAVRLRDQSSITASAGANGGNITISAPDLVYLMDSQITATAGRNGRNGKGGNITIDPQFIVLNNSLISANAAAGQGGNINLVSDFFFNSNSLITATGTTNGTVNITAPPLDLGAELITLPSSLLSAENQLQESCTALLRGDFSSFISIGRGGTEPEPDELQEEF